MIDYLIIFFLVTGFFFLMIGAVGLLRLPDLYTRMHAVGKCDTLGAGLMLIGLMLYIADMTSVMKLILVGVLVATINPVMTHLIAKTAYNRGTEMVKGSCVIDDYNATGGDKQTGESA